MPPADDRARAAPWGSPAATPVRRVRKAYEQVADQLRELIVRGELHPGDRLPVESALARDFGVSRATVREALRLLAAQSLVRTEKGATGGSYVTLPTAATISSLVHANVGLLAETRSVTLQELLEARELVEVPAVRLAAARRDADDLDRLRGTVPGDAAAPLDDGGVLPQRRVPLAPARGKPQHAARRLRPADLLRPADAPRALGARRSGSTARSTSTTTGSSPPWKPATVTSPPPRCTTTSRFLRPYYEKAWRRSVAGRSRG